MRLEWSPRIAGLSNASLASELIRAAHQRVDQVPGLNEFVEKYLRVLALCEGFPSVLIDALGGFPS